VLARPELTEAVIAAIRDCGGTDCGIIRTRINTNKAY